MNKIFSSKFWIHFLAAVVVLIWGCTFINSKLLLNHGMEAHEIYALRFLFAYVCILFISPRKLWSESWQDELRMFVLGITGGTLYFITENEAVRIGYVNNVSFIVCTAPMVTTLLALIFIKEVKATRNLVVGTILATLGVGFVIFNGHFVLNLNPLGDMLALCACLCWAIYSILLKNVSEKYSAVFITRKVFFYGLVTVLPVFIFSPWHFSLNSFMRPVVWGNLLFLGFVASFMCFVLWSWVSKQLGALVASNYIYLNPISTVVFSAIFLGETMTPMAFIGSSMILFGVYLSNKPKR
jgi:drug/metabolite transporter (DMT)-like permease